MEEEDRLENPCKYCGGAKVTIKPGGQTWRGVKGYSPAQYYHLTHSGVFRWGDGFQNCSVSLRGRTKEELLGVWNDTNRRPM